MGIPGILLAACRLLPILDSACYVEGRRLCASDWGRQAG